MQKELISDGKLLGLYQQGNEAALETLINRHKSRIFTGIYLLVNDRYLAEDVFQETFIKIINCLRQGKYTHSDKFAPWAIRIARNIIIDNARALKRQPPITDSDGNNIFDFIKLSEESVESKMIMNEKNKGLRYLIHQLPADQREVLIMRHYADLSFKEIAEITQTNINTCMGRMHYAMMNLKKMILKQTQTIKVPKY